MQRSGAAVGTRSAAVVGVVVPAHDEQGLLPATLAALRVAARHPALRRTAVHVLTVLDRCSDDTGEVAGQVIEVRVGNVGAARAAGFAHLLAREAGRDLQEVWLTTTDADTLVPPDWLARQLLLRGRGADAVTGTVRVSDWHQQSRSVRRTFGRTYGRPTAGHGHVHGANLGISASSYVAVGGFAPLALAEDQSLIDAARRAGHRVCATGSIPVVTSARPESRTTGGFADHLRQLGRATLPAQD